MGFFQNKSDWGESKLEFAAMYSIWKVARSQKNFTATQRGHALLTCHLFMCPGPTLETSSTLVTPAQLTLPDLDPLKSSLFLNANRRNRL